MIFSRFSILVILIGVFLLPFQSRASETLKFIDKDTFSDKRVISGLSTYSYKQIAAVDLNNDSINEYILSDANTGNDVSRHEFSVIAQTDTGFADLGVIKAKRLAVAYVSNGGVRNLIGYNADENDFEYDVYAWDAVHSRFANKKDLDREGRP